MLAYGFPGGQVANSVLIQKLYVYKDIKENLSVTGILCTYPEQN